MANLLLVEDDKQLSTMYSKKFATDGWDVTIAHDGTEGVRLGKEGDFNAIVLDIMLPGMSGIDVLEMLRSDKRTAKIPIIVYTNYGDKYNRDKCLTYGADEFVLKVDSTPDSLSQTLKKVMRKNEA
jgi:CheY-like chemotaxis protein